MAATADIAKAAITAVRRVNWAKVAGIARVALELGPCPGCSDLRKENAELRRLLGESPPGREPAVLVSAP